jgi:GNAT superfamily N-acetyltransferase
MSNPRGQNSRMAVIRRAERTDIAAIVGLLADDLLGQSRERLTDPLADEYFAAFDAIDSDPNQFLAVMTDGFEVIATLQLSFIPGLARCGAWRGQIEAVRVAAGRRSHGCGAAMLEWAIDECRKRGCALVQLTTDRQRPDAHRFYEQLGFEPTHIGYKLKL